MRLLLLFAALMLSVAAFAHATPAWAGHAMDPIVDTWTAYPKPTGGAYYSNGLDSVETYPSGPSSFTYFGTSRDGRQTMGTIYQTPRYDQPSAAEQRLRDWQYEGPRLAPPSRERR